MARCQCGDSGGECNCFVIAGDGIDVVGDGSAAAPFIVSVEPGDCNCLVTAGPGIDVTGDGGPGTPFVVSAEDAVTGCGITGTGKAGSPLSANVDVWPFVCDITANAGGIYCDATTGKLHADPRPTVRSVQAFNTTAFPDVLVPPGLTTVAATRTLTFTNTDPCRDAFVIFEFELDVDFDLPPGGGANVDLGGDDMQYLFNRGTSQANSVHQQSTKLYTFTVPPATLHNESLPIIIGRGSGGATYASIRSIMRAWIFNL